jgi:hypothetical protein
MMLMRPDRGMASTPVVKLTSSAQDAEVPPPRRRRRARDSVTPLCATTPLVSSSSVQPRFSAKAHPHVQPTDEGATVAEKEDAPTVAAAVVVGASRFRGTTDCQSTMAALQQARSDAITRFLREHNRSTHQRSDSLTTDDIPSTLSRSRDSIAEPPSSLLKVISKTTDDLNAPVGVPTTAKHAHRARARERERERERDDEDVLHSAPG